jgi:molybdate transport system substrate-binding protein
VFGRVVAAALGAMAFAVTACGGADEKATRQITVFAAASLTEAFVELGRAFEASHGGARVRFSFGASSTLAQQAIHGAPADVLATADEASLQRVLGAGAVPAIFARNRLEIAVGKGNPKKLTALADLAWPGVVLVSCAPEVPCGRFASQALAKAAVRAAPKSLEENVKAVLTKVSLGEADAGIVYVTDVRSASGRVEGVAIPDEHNVLASYPIAALKTGGNVEGGRAFVDFVLSDAGRRVLDRYGFLSP